MILPTSLDKNADNNVIEVMFFLSQKGISILESNYKKDFCKKVPVADEKGKFEIFMMNLLLFSIYFGNRGAIKNASVVEEIIFRLFEYSKNFYINKTYSEISDLYTERFEWIKKDFVGVSNSNYPVTKQYLPAYTFTVIYYDQLKIIPTNIDFLDHHSEQWDLERQHELDDFLGAYCEQINWITNLNAISYLKGFETI